MTSSMESPTRNLTSWTLGLCRACLASSVILVIILLARFRGDSYFLWFVCGFRKWWKGLSSGDTPAILSLLLPLPLPAFVAAFVERGRDFIIIRDAIVLGAKCAVIWIIDGNILDEYECQMDVIKSIE